MPQQYWVILTQMYDLKTGEKYKYDSVMTLYDVDEDATKNALKEREKLYCEESSRYDSEQINYYPSFTLFEVELNYTEVQTIIPAIK